MYTKEDRKADALWFSNNYEELGKLYGHSILAVRNGKVIDTFGNYEHAIREMGMGNCSLHECDDMLDKDEVRMCIARF